MSKKTTCAQGCGTSYEGRVCPSCRLPASSLAIVRLARHLAIDAYETKNNVKEWAEKWRRFNAYISNLPGQSKSMRSVFTFGFGQYCSCGRALANHYTVIEALNPREEMVRRWGRSWSFEYPAEAEAGVQEFGLSLIDFEKGGGDFCACGNEVLKKDTCKGCAEFYCPDCAGKPAKLEPPVVSFSRDDASRIYHVVKYLASGPGIEYLQGEVESLLRLQASEKPCCPHKACCENKI